MSGQNQPQGNQGQQGGQPQGQQGGQPQGQQGGQPQGGQPPGGPQQPPQQGGRPPAGGGGGGSPLDTLKEPEPKQYLISIAGTLAILAIATFLVIALVGAVGSPPMTNDQFEDIDDSDAKSNAEEQRQDALKQSLVNAAMLIGPFVPIIIGGLAGAVVGSNLNRPQNDVLLTVAAGTFAGAFLFMILTVYLTTSQLPDNGSVAAFGGDNVAFVPLLIDSVLIGVASVVSGVGTAYLALMD